MEKSENRSLKGFFKNVGSTLHAIFIEEDEIDNDVELPAELRADPVLAFNNFQVPTEKAPKVQRQRARTQKAPTKSSRKKSVDTDELSR